VLAVAATGARTRGDFARADELAERALASGRPNDPELRYPLMVQSGLALFHGRLDEADRLADRAAQLARAAADPGWVVHAVVNRSVTAAYGGDLPRARELAAEAEAEARPTRNPTALGWASYAGAEAVSGEDPDRATELLTRSRAHAAAGRDRYLAGVALVALAALHGRHGDPAAALQLSAEVIDHWHRAGNWTQQWTTLRNVVEPLIRLGADDHAVVPTPPWKAAPPPLPHSARRRSASSGPGWRCGRGWERRRCATPQAAQAPSSTTRWWRWPARPSPSWPLNASQRQS
jgi:ATP/maltotriose-dependent transcriptional regulator MalT